MANIVSCEPRLTLNIFSLTSLEQRSVAASYHTMYNSHFFLIFGSMVAVSAALHKLLDQHGNRPLKTLSPEWVEASKKYSIYQNQNPITCVPKK